MDNLESTTEVNYIDLCFISMVSTPYVVNNFRPISLRNSIYKILGRIVTNRLGIGIDNTISYIQIGFIAGRSIHENIVMTQEMLHSMNKLHSKKCFFATKLDLAKAYEMMSWNFLNNMLESLISLGKLSW